METPTSAQQVNHFNNSIGLLTSEGKKQGQETTTGSPGKEKYDGNSKEIIKFID